MLHTGLNKGYILTIHYIFEQSHSRNFRVQSTKACHIFKAKLTRDSNCFLNIFFHFDRTQKATLRQCQYLCQYPRTAMVQMTQMGTVGAVVWTLLGATLVWEMPTLLEEYPQEPQANQTPDLAYQVRDVFSVLQMLFLRLVHFCIPLLPFSLLEYFDLTLLFCSVSVLISFVLSCLVLCLLFLSLSCLDLFRLNCLVLSCRRTCRVLQCLVCVLSYVSCHSVLSYVSCLVMSCYLYCTYICILCILHLYNSTLFICITDQTYPN